MNTKAKSLFHTQNMVLSALFAAIMCILAPFTIPTPIIPVSLAPFIITLAGLVLGPGLGACSILIYVLLGLAGLPVYSNHQAGAGILFGATGGFLFGYIFMALIVGFGKNKKLPLNFLFLFLGLTVCYFGGFLSLRMVTSSWSFLNGMIPLYLKDLVVGGAAIFLGREILKRIRNI